MPKNRKPTQKQLAAARKKRKRRPPKVPRVKDPKTGKFITRKEMEKRIMSEAQNPVMPILTAEEEERMALEQAELQSLEDQIAQGLTTLETPQKDVQTSIDIDEEIGQTPQEPSMESQFQEALGKDEPGIDRQKLIEEANKSLKDMEDGTEIQPSPPPSPPGMDPATGKIVPYPQTREQTQKKEADTSQTTSPLPQETTASSQESQGPVPNPVDPGYTKFAEYVKLNVGEPFCLAHLNSLLANPSVVPHVSHWTLPAELEMPKVMTAMIHQPGYLENVWPTLKVIMGVNITNTAWAATVAVSLAFYDCLKILPQAIHLRSLQS